MQFHSKIPVLFLELILQFQTDAGIALPLNIETIAFTKFFDLWNFLFPELVLLFQWRELEALIPLVTKNTLL